MTFLVVTEKQLRGELRDATTWRNQMVNEAGGETLDSLAESAVIAYLLDLKKRIYDAGGFEINLTLRDVFIAGYIAGEERKWK